MLVFAYSLLFIVIIQTVDALCTKASKSKDDDKSFYGCVRNDYGAPDGEHQLTTRIEW